jgi:PHD/YefM family antitoxin component YafN of YafNO toxin-antitoxin module
LIRTPNIQSLTEFQRSSKATLASLKRSGEPLVLTVNGRAEAILQDAAAYQRLLDRLDRMEIMEGIRRGLADARAGRTIPLAKAKQMIRARNRKPRRG